MKSPLGSTLTELPQVPSYSDEPWEQTPCPPALDPPRSEPCKETLCPTGVFSTAAARHGTPTMESAPIKFVFFGWSSGNCLRRRKKWVEPRKYFKICSLKVFKRRFFADVYCSSRARNAKLPRLMADDLGPCAYPTIQANDCEFERIDRSPLTLSKRTKRMVR